MIALGFGELEQARSLIPEALAVGARAQATMAVPAFRLHRYLLNDFEGRIEQSEVPLTEAVRDFPARPVFRCALAYLHARLERTTEAKTVIADFAGSDFSALPFDFEWLYATTLLAETCAMVGDHESGAVLYRLLLPYEGLSVVDAPEGMRGAVARYLGIIAALARPETAEGHFEKALEINANAGTRPWLAHTQEDYARMLLERDGPGDRSGGEVLLASALATYRELGMEGPLTKATAVAAK